MNHLLIGAAEAPHLREYARSWEQATSVRPRICGWAEVATAAPPSPTGLVVRAAAPVPEEVGALEAIGGAAPAGADVESAPAALTGLVRALGALEQGLGEGRGAVRWATPPQSLALLLDLELRQRCFERDGIPTPAAWPVDGRGAHQAYEALKERLRYAQGGHGGRVVLRLRRGLGPLVPTPTVLLWSGGRGVRAQANCQFTPAGAARGPVHPIDDEAELRPLVGRLLELGAVVNEDWPTAELGGRPFVLSLLATASRVAFGQVGPGGAWRVRGDAPEPGVPREVAAVRRQIARDLYERIEETCVRLCRLHRCAALVVDVALSRRFDDFRVLDVDPFAELPGDRRDAVGWSAYDHLVRQVRTLPEGEAQAAASG